MNRREWISRTGLAAAMGARESDSAAAQAYRQATRGLPPLKITGVKVILTNPPYANGSFSFMQRLVIAKVETSEPGLYGLGCASFVFRPAAVAAVIEQYLRPFVVGKDPDMIGDLFQSMHVSSLWRSGPIHNYAVGGIDMALWDIKGKRAGMPVYQLLGGKTRSAVQCYSDASGRDAAEMSESVKKVQERGYRHVRLNYTGRKVAETPALAGMPTSDVIDPDEWVREIPKIFEGVRKTCGEEVELIQHLHGQLPPQATIGMVKRLEPFRPYFFEDPFYPEDIGYLKNLRQLTTVPIGTSEKFVNEHEYVDLVTERLVDFIRVHVPAIGGMTKSWKLAILGEWFAVRTAWHAPADLSPVGHAANGHLDLAAPNFGIQEGSVIHGEAIREVFPGTPVIRNGYLHINEAPGLGIDIDEKAAAKFPVNLHDGNWGPRRSANGSVIGN